MLPIDLDDDFQSQKAAGEAESIDSSHSVFDANKSDKPDDRTALWWAAESGNDAVVKLLLAAEDIDVNSKDTFYGRTALSQAA